MSFFITSILKHMNIFWNILTVQRDPVPKHSIKVLILKLKHVHNSLEIYKLDHLRFIHDYTNPSEI